VLQPSPLKESRPEIRSERLLRVEKHVTHVHISDSHKTVLSEGEYLRMWFSSGHNMYRHKLILEMSITRDVVCQRNI
jgi:hypothetical protein